MAQEQFWEKFLLICWKNWRLVVFFRYIVIISMMAPVAFVAILLAVRSSNNVERYDQAIEEPLNLKTEWIKFIQRITAIHHKLSEKSAIMYNYFVPDLIVGFAPNQTIYIDLMKTASVMYLNNIKLIGFDTGDELRTAIMEEHFLAGVLFKNEKNELMEERMESFYRLSLPGDLFNLAYSLIFPSELRFFEDSFIGQSWRTNTLNLPYSELNKKTSLDSVNYIREGFVSLQHAVSMSYIQTIATTTDVPEVLLNQFPRRAHVYDPMLSHLSFILPFLIAVGYMHVLSRVCMGLTKQKLYKRKKILYIHGVGSIIHTVTWILTGLLMLLVPGIFVLFSMKIGIVHGFGLCSRSSWSVLFLFLFCYSLSSVCFCFMTSNMLKNVPYIIIVSGVLWPITFLPYVTTQNELPIGMGTQFLSALLPNTAFGNGFSKIIELERKGEGVQWSNLFEFNKSDRVSSVGVHCILLIALSLAYTGLGIILPKLPLFFRMIRGNLLPSKSSTTLRVSTSNSSVRKTKVLEIKNENKRVLVELKNLTKIRCNKKVINELSVNIYEGEVTVVMGHNGSGKTTLLAMIAGIIFPTSGSIKFNKIPLEDLIEYLIEDFSIGVGVPEMLHPELTVAQQILMYSRLKGLDKESAQEEVIKYTRALKLESVSDVYTARLTNNFKRCLYVSCCLCGNSKLVIIDEPSTGMDSMCKQRIWDLIIQEKRNRTVIVATHSPEEAEILGDNLLILSGGELMCYGSMFFMRSMYGKGHRLICHKTPYCDTQRVTAFLRDYIHQIFPESDIGMELCYRLQERYSVIFPKLLADLEESFEMLEIKGCSITEPVIEDIVLLMGTEDSTETDRFRQSDVMSGHTIYAEEYKKHSYLQEFEAYKGLKLFIVHLQALLLMKFNCEPHGDKFLLYIFLPVSVTLLTYAMSNPTFDRIPLRPMTFRLTQYPESVTPIAGNVLNFNQSIYNQFLEYVSDLPSMSVVHKLEIIRSFSFIDAILEKQDSPKYFNEKYLVGVSFENGTTTAWFNNYWLHTAPLSLNLVHNGILSEFRHSGRITVTNEPLPLRAVEDLPDLRDLTDVGNLLALMLSYLICFIYSYTLYLLVDERINNFKLLQAICGLSKSEFYIGAFLFDLVKVLIISLSVFIVSLVFTNNIPDQIRAAAFCLLIMIIFGICITPFYYLLALACKDAFNGYWFICIYNVCGVSCFIALLQTIESHHIEQLENMTSFRIVSYMFPHFFLCKSLTKVFTAGKARFICKNEYIRHASVVYDGCNTLPNCCIDPKEWEWVEWGILPEIMYFLILGILATILLCIYEHRSAWKKFLGFTIPLDNIELSLEEYKRSHNERYEYQNDVINERTRVEQLARNKYRSKSIVLSNVSKIFGRKVAVNRLTFAINRGELFGLLGVNQSGKSTLLKLLIGYYNMTFGRAYVEGISVTDNIRGVHKLIGYCPHSQCFPSYMTCHQIMKYCCQLRGMPTDLIEDLSLSLAKTFGIMKNLDKKILYISPGIKRRLCTAITFIGKPPVVLLDELSAGIDPGARRQIWNILYLLLRINTTIFVTQHDPLETEKFCTRVGIIKSGSLVCVGYVSQLQSKYTKVYNLRLKLKANVRFDEPTSGFKAQEYSRHSVSKQVPKISTYIGATFPDATLIYRHGGSLSYLIPAYQDISLSQIFKKIKRKAVTFYVDSFSVHRVTLPFLMADLIEERPPEQDLKDLSEDSFDED